MIEFLCSCYTNQRGCKVINILTHQELVYAVFKLFSISTKTQRYLSQLISATGGAVSIVNFRPCHSHIAPLKGIYDSKYVTTSLQRNVGGKNVLKTSVFRLKKRHVYLMCIVLLILITSSGLFNIQSTLLGLSHLSTQLRVLGSRLCWEMKSCPRPPNKLQS